MDAYVSTGQGLLGNNMFAYCGNNPVCCADSSGTISYTCIGDNHLFTPMALMDCGGGGGGFGGIGGPGPWDESGHLVNNGVGKWLADVYDTITSVNQQQAQLQTQITMQQNEMIANAAEGIWDAYMRGYNLQQAAQLQNTQAIIEGMEYFINHPKKAEGVLRGMVGTSTAVVKLVSVSLAGGPTGVLILATAVAVWDMGWTISDIISDFR